MKIISCNSNLPLAQAIAAKLLIPLTPATVKKFHDGEIFVEIHDDVRGEDVFVIQSTCFPVNDNIMELLIILDALKRAAAKRIIAVIPYFGYARQDRMPTPRTSITAKLMADIITSAGADRVLTLDLHAGQIQGFFNIPVDNLYAAPVFVENIKANYPKDVLIVSPDVGGVVRARVIARLLNADLAIVDKRREEANKSEVVNIIGDVKGRDCILIDDMVDTAGTLCNAAASLVKQGANSVSAYVSHGILSGEAVTKVAQSKLYKLVITDSINITLKNETPTSKIEILSVAPLLAEAVKNIAEERLVSCLNTKHH